MKKILLPILALILTACSSPQVTATRLAEVTATLPPPTATIIPTPTLNPQFVIMQEQITASGERFSLLPDGTIQETTSDGVKAVMGLSVDETGQIKILLNGQEVEIDSANVAFDDAGGLNVKGYTFDKEKKEWSQAETKGYFDKLDIVFQSPVTEIQFAGVHVPKILASTAVERSGGRHSINKVEMPPKLLAETTMRAMHAIFMPEEDDTPENVAAFAKILGQIQRGERTCSDLTHSLKVYDAHDSGESVEINFVPACGASVVPDGMTELKGIEFVYGAFYITNDDDTHSPNPDMPWFVRSTPSSAGYGVMWDDKSGILKLMVGVNYLTNKENSRVMVATYTEMIVDWLKYYSNGNKSGLSLGETK